VSDNVTRKLIKAYDLTWWDTKGIVEVQAEVLTGEDEGCYKITTDGWDSWDFRWCNRVFFHLDIEEAKETFENLRRRELDRIDVRLRAIRRLSKDKVLAYPFPETFE
jgi:hypothetical protein